MRPQLDNKIITSFLLYIDNRIQQRGEAFYNTNGLFYPTQSNINGLYAYTCPYKQLCNDTSVPNATVMSGVYLNNNYISVGQSGLTAINHYDGALYFNSGLPKNTIISGNFAIKDFSVYLSDQPDFKLLFETKYYPNPRYGNIPKSGLSLDIKTAPAIYLVTKVQENRPLAFAGLDDNAIQLRAVVVAENAYQKIAVCNILKNLFMRPFRLVESTPFDYLGNMTGINYNYTTLPTNDFYKPLVLKSKVTEINLDGEFLDMKKQFAFVDFDISTWNGNV